LPYSPGLDGLRALAVIAVLLYHAELACIPGGFLGVEVFFVISGYLITALLLAEWRQRGRIGLKTFWMRRARRLLPALYVLLVVCLAFAVVFLPGEVARLRGDVLAALGYATNWYLIFGHVSYFEAVGRRSLLQHLWSLAVEEQFYLIWPPVLALGLLIGATRLRRRRMLIVALAGAGASAVATALLYAPGVDPSRIYYGTDTRATGLLCGAALAFLWSPGDKYRPSEERHHRLELGGRGRFRRRWGWTAPLLLDIVGFAALGGLIWFFLHLGEFRPFLYKGGFALVALSTTALIMTVVNPYTLIGARLLGSAPLCWIGVRSYGIYLWHWPVFMVSRPDLDVPFDGLPLLALRLGVTVLLADLSYRFVETPIRRGALGRTWRTCAKFGIPGAGGLGVSGRGRSCPSWPPARCSVWPWSRPKRPRNPPTFPPSASTSRPRAAMQGRPPRPKGRPARRGKPRRRLPRPPSARAGGRPRHGHARASPEERADSPPSSRLHLPPAR